MINININKLVPHPQNPRKDLGDLTELANSIKTNGVFQNLTVVKNDDDDTYTIVIGHRRCAAAKLAGIETMPCSVVKMDYETQLATMLVENMQRSDLTVYEQAEGIQLLLDNGFKVDDVAEKTGFSKSTIQRRTKLLDLDKEKFRESQQRNVSLEDYEKLNQLKNVENKNKALEVIGTNNFNNQISLLIIKEKEEYLEKKVREKLYFASEIINSDIYNGDKEYIYKFITRLPISGYDYENNIKVIEKFEQPAPHEDGEYVFCISYCCAELYVKIKREDTDEIINEKSELSKRLENWQEKSDEINARFYSLRKEFVKELIFSNNDVNNAITTSIAIIAEKNINKYIRIEDDDIEELTELSYDNELEKITNINITENINAAAKIIFIMAYISFKDDDNNGYISLWDNSPWKNNISLNELYDFICKFGYELCDEEKQLRDGTHSIYFERPKNNEVE